MKTGSKNKPTDAELEILRILWEHGPSSVKLVNDKLNEKRDVGYTTTLKLLQIMTDKKLVEREKSGRSHIYKSSLKQSETQKVLLDKILDTAFGGSAGKLVMQALGNHKASKEEIGQIRELLDKIEREGK